MGFTPQEIEQRTARYAYSAAGDRQAAGLGKSSSGRSWKAASRNGSRSRLRCRRSNETTRRA